MTVFDRIKRNPVLIAGFVLSVLTALYEAYVANSGLTLAVLVPFVTSVVTRLFTVPASEVVDLDELLGDDENELESLERTV